MDPHHWDLVNECLPQLLTLTNCNQIFLACFREARILSYEDVDSIQAAGYAGEIPKSARFYDLILMRGGSFEVLLEALQRTDQSGALELLQNRLNAPRSANDGMLPRPKNVFTKFITRVIGDPNYTIVTNPEHIYVHNFGMLPHGVKATEIGVQLVILCASYPVYFVRTIMQSRFDVYGPGLNLWKPSYLNPANFYKYCNIIMRTNSNNPFVFYHGLLSRIAQQSSFTFFSKRIGKYFPWISCESDKQYHTGRNNLWNTLGNIICATFGTIFSHAFHVLAVTTIRTVLTRNVADQTVLQIVAVLYKSQGVSVFFSGLFPRIFGTVLYITIFEITYNRLVLISKRCKWEMNCPGNIQAIISVFVNVMARSATYAINSTATAVSIYHVNLWQPGQENAKTRRSDFLFLLANRAENKILGKGAIAMSFLPFILL